VIGLRATLLEQKYDAIDASELTDEKMKQLETVYEPIELMAGISENLKKGLFALTQGKDTYLLPSYFNLNLKEQEVVLFRELFFREFFHNFDRDRKKEMTHGLQSNFQCFMTGANPIQFIHYVFYALMDQYKNSPWYVLSAYLKYDIKSGALGDLVDANGNLNVYPLITTNERDFSDLQEKYPKSLFLNWYAMMRKNGQWTFWVPQGGNAKYSIPNPFWVRTNMSQGLEAFLTSLRSVEFERTWWECKGHPDWERNQCNSDKYIQKTKKGSAILVPSNFSLLLDDDIVNVIINGVAPKYDPSVTSTEVRP